MTVDRSDLENKLREIESIVNETRERARSTGTMLAAAAVTIAVVVFLIGRRRGKKAGGARLEVYRLS